MATKQLVLVLLLLCKCMPVLLKALEALHNTLAYLIVLAYFLSSLRYPHIMIFTLTLFGELLRRLWPDCCRNLEVYM